MLTMHVRYAPLRRLRRARGRVTQDSIRILQLADQHVGQPALSSGMGKQSVLAYGTGATWESNLKGLRHAKAGQNH